MSNFVNSAVLKGFPYQYSVFAVTASLMACRRHSLGSWMSECLTFVGRKFRCCLSFRGGVTHAYIIMFKGGDRRATSEALRRLFLA